MSFKTNSNKKVVSCFFGSSSEVTGRLEFDAKTTANGFSTLLSYKRTKIWIETSMSGLIPVVTDECEFGSRHK